MTIFSTILVTLFILNAFVTVLLIDTPREPMNAATASVIVLLDILIIIGLIYKW